MDGSVGMVPSTSERHDTEQLPGDPYYLCNAFLSPLTVTGRDMPHPRLRRGGLLACTIGNRGAYHALTRNNSLLQSIRLQSSRCFDREHLPHRLKHTPERKFRGRAFHHGISRS